MRSADVIVIGAGQAGLATSHCLGLRGIDHVVLDRGRVAERWDAGRACERWCIQFQALRWTNRLSAGGDAERSQLRTAASPN